MKVVIILYLYLFGRLGDVKAQQCSQPELGGCLCFGTIVECTNTMHTSVPDNIPITTTILLLSANKITEITDDSFSNLPDLVELGIFSNPITKISVNAFSNLSNLRVLNLAYIDITVLPDNIFESLTNLSALFLYATNLSVLPDGIFNRLINLVQLELDLNQLTEFPLDSFLMLTNLKKLSLSGNPTYCCDLLDLIEFGKTLETFTLTCNDFNAVIEYNEFNSSYCPIDGQWSEWTTSECSVTCGDGIITRTRECNNPTPANGGEDCVGSATEEIPCLLEKCPAIDGQWSDWTSSECSVTCGDGIILRTRECNDPAPANGGQDCVGSATEEIPCSLDKCHGNSCEQERQAFLSCMKNRN